MSNVFKFDRKEPQDPHMSGVAACNACQNEWIAILPTGSLTTSLECPSCHAMKGYMKHHCVYEGKQMWHCLTCQGFLFTIVLFEDVPTACCANCSSAHNLIDTFPQR
jgi:hypothetical protein